MQNLHELAKDPKAFDTQLAELYRQQADLEKRVRYQLDQAHKQAGDKQVTRHRITVWTMPDEDALIAARDARSNYLSVKCFLDAVTAEIKLMDIVYRSAPWSRFFPSVTNSGGHIHASLSCHTLHYTTEVHWTPELSGRTEADAVDAFGPALCTVCFPSAPVDRTSGTLMTPERRAAQEQRAAEKATRDAKKAAKELTPGERFTTVHGRDTVRTVAACKEVIRQAVEERVELAWLESGKAAAAWLANGYNVTAEQVAEQVSQHIERTRRNITEMDQDAEQAERVLVAREERTPGHGMTADDIAAMRTRKDRAARKAWGI